MIDITWQPAYTIKAYPELRGLFSRGENHLLAYLHNWTVQLTKKGKAQDPEWIFLTQQQIAESIDYSVSSVKRFINQINQKIHGAVEVRSKQVHLTKFFAYTVWEYRVSWPEVITFLASQNDNTNLLQTPEMAQSSHLHFEPVLVHPERAVVHDEPDVAQDELIYKDQFKDQLKDQVNKKISTPTPFQSGDNGSGDRSKTYDNLVIRNQIDCHTPQLDKSNIPASQPTDSGENIPPAPKKMSSLTSQQAASMGLTRQNNSEVSQAWVENPGGRPGNRSSWADQGIALGLWTTKDMGLDFQGAVICYGRNQDWCRSPLDYANSVIRGLIRGDDPKADRFWEAWRNHLPIAWENLFDWEVQPGVINPAFSNWVNTQLFDGSKTSAANSAEVAKQLRFNSRQLWQKFQREVDREAVKVQQHRDRGQTYLPPGAMLPRTDQPTTGETKQQLQDMVKAAEVVALAAQSETNGELTGSVCSRSVGEDQSPERQMNLLIPDQNCDYAHTSLGTVRDVRMFTRLTNLGASSSRLSAITAIPCFDEACLNPSFCLDVKSPEFTEFGLDADCVQSEIPELPLVIRLLAEIVQRRRSLELSWRRKSHKYDLVKVAKYLVWSEKGDDAMKLEAIDWLEKNYER